MADEIVVKLTLRRATAERLRLACHRRGETASTVVDRWILTNLDEAGADRTVTPPKSPAEKLLETIRRGPFGF